MAWVTPVQCVTSVWLLKWQQRPTLTEAESHSHICSTTFTKTNSVRFNMHVIAGEKERANASEWEEAHASPHGCSYLTSATGRSLLASANLFLISCSLWSSFPLLLHKVEVFGPKITQEDVQIRGEAANQPSNNFIIYIKGSLPFGGKCRK